MADPLRTVADLKLDGFPFRLAGNGRYCLCAPQEPDPFMVVAHAEVDPKDLSPEQIVDMIQLLGASIEKCAKLEAALQKGVMQTDG